MRRLTLREARRARSMLWIMNWETGIMGPAVLGKLWWQRRYLITRLESYAGSRQKEWVDPRDYGETWVCYTMEG